MLDADHHISQMEDYIILYHHTILSNSFYTRNVYYILVESAKRGTVTTVVSVSVVRNHFIAIVKRYVNRVGCGRLQQP